MLGQIAFFVAPGDHTRSRSVRVRPDPVKADWFIARWTHIVLAGAQLGSANKQASKNTTISHFG
jgi:hypothetical protein